MPRKPYALFAVVRKPVDDMCHLVHLFGSQILKFRDDFLDRCHPFIVYQPEYQRRILNIVETAGPKARK